MHAKKGDRIIVEATRVGQPTREGEILEVQKGEVGERYVVRWSDGRQSIFTPSAGSAKIIPKVKKRS